MKGYSTQLLDWSLIIGCSLISYPIHYFCGVLPTCQCILSPADSGTQWLRDMLLWWPGKSLGSEMFYTSAIYLPDIAPLDYQLLIYRILLTTKISIPWKTKKKRELKQFFVEKLKSCGRRELWSWQKEENEGFSKYLVCLFGFYGTSTFVGYHIYQPLRSGRIWYKVNF